MSTETINPNLVMSDDVLATPELEAAPKEADVHRGSITAVESQHFDSGATAIKVSLTSIDTGADDSLSIFVPKTFAENTGAFLDPATAAQALASLPTVPPEGKKMSERDQYARAISCSGPKNKDGSPATDKETGEVIPGDAQVQTLIHIAKKQGRTLTGATRPTNFEEYVGLLSSLLTGVEVVFSRTPDKNEGPFKGRLRVNGIFGPETVSNPKRFKKYVKRWESQ